MKKFDQKGFSPFETVLLVLVIAALGFAGYVVFTKNKPEQQATDTTVQKEQTKTYTDSAKNFTFQYPATWEASRVEAGGGDFNTEPDWSVTSQYVDIKPFKSTENNYIHVNPDCNVQTITDRKASNDQFHTQQDLKINGYDAFYDKLDFKGDAETYLNHTYIVLSGSSCVRFDFRENWHHDMSGTNFDDHQNLAGFQAIVNSIKFTN